MADTDARLATIRALLAKAESTDSEHEREACMAKAAELAAKYGIDEALLAATRERPVLPGELVIECEAPYALDKKDLLINVASPLGCKNVWAPRWRDGKKLIRVCLVGFESDLVRVELLYTSLLVQQASGLAAAEIPWYIKTAPAKAAWRRSWMLGFRWEIFRRLRAAEERARHNAEEERAAAAPGTPGVALVLADRSALVDRTFAELHGKPKTARTRRLGDDGVTAGVVAGSRAYLGGTEVTAPSRRQLPA